MKPLRITAVEATPVNVPFSRPEFWSYGAFMGMTSIIVRIRTDGGIVGIGEAVSGGPSIQVMLTAIRELGELLVGKDPTDIEANVRHLTYVGGWHWYGRRTAVVLSGIEMALWDVMGKALGVPIYKLLGGAVAERLPFMYFLQRKDTDKSSLLAEAKQAVNDGFGTVYIKGGASVDDDIELLAELRQGLGEGIKLRLDLNEAWMPGTAVTTLRRLEKLNLEFVEQPLRYSDLDQLARLRHATSVPIAANQSAWTMKEVLEVIKVGAADVIVTDVHQAGGISGLRRAIDLCEVAGLPVVYHAFTALTIGITASMHVMCTRPNSISLAHQLYAPGMVTEDIVTEALDAKTGSAPLPAGPGLGLELDTRRFEEAAARFVADGPYPLFDPNHTPAWVPMI